MNCGDYVPANEETVQQSNDLPKTVFKIIWGRLYQDFTLENGKYVCISQWFREWDDGVYWEDQHGNEIYEPDDDCDEASAAADPLCYPNIYRLYCPYRMVKPVYDKKEVKVEDIEMTKITLGCVKQEFAWQDGEYVCVNNEFTEDSNIKDDNDEVGWEDKYGNDVPEPEYIHCAYDMVEPSEMMIEYEKFKKHMAGLQKRPKLLQDIKEAFERYLEALKRYQEAFE